MSSAMQTWTEHEDFVYDIEVQMDGFLKAQKDKIERSLLDKINREREDAQKKIDEMEREFEKEKSLLEDYKSILLHLQSSKNDVVKRIREHFEKTVGCQKQIKMFSDMANEELQRISDLSRELEAIRNRAEEETARVKKILEERFGIEAKLPEAFDFIDVPPEWSREVGRMEKLREVLEMFYPAGGSGEQAVENKGNGDPRAMAVGMTASATKAKAAPATVEPDFPPTMPEELSDDDIASDIEGGTDGARVGEQEAQAQAQAPEAGDGEDETVELSPPQDMGPDGDLEEDSYLVAGDADFSDADGEQVEEVARAETEEAAETEAGTDVGTAVAVETAPRCGEDLEVLGEKLAKYRHAEAVANGAFFGYYQNENERILDGEALFDAVDRVTDEAVNLHSVLTEKESIKDVFMLKQEILNVQEILRKLFFRAITFCEKEDGLVPRYSSDVLNSDSIKDVLEKLTIGNWSDPGEFKVFVKELACLKGAFRNGDMSLAEYRKSVLDQVEGR